MLFVTWNILADRFCDKERISPNSIIDSFQWDVICLQEVELNEIDFSFSYVSHTGSKKRTSPIGNLTGYQ